MAKHEQEPVLKDTEADVRLKNLAKKNLAEFFGNKKYYCGGTIPTALLFSEESLEFYVDTSFNEGLQYCQENVISQIPEPESYKGKIEWDIQIVLDLLNDAKAVKIPIANQAGTILLYFKLCRGCRVSRREYSEWFQDNFEAA